MCTSQRIGHLRYLAVAAVPNCHSVRSGSPSSRLQWSDPCGMYSNTTLRSQVYSLLRMKALKGVSLHVRHDSPGLAGHAQRCECGFGTPLLCTLGRHNSRQEISSHGFICFALPLLDTDRRCVRDSPLARSPTRWSRIYGWPVARTQSAVPALCTRLSLLYLRVAPWMICSWRLSPSSLRDNALCIRRQETVCSCDPTPDLKTMWKLAWIWEPLMWKAWWALDETCIYRVGCLWTDGSRWTFCASAER